MLVVSSSTRMRALALGQDERVFFFFFTRPEKDGGSWYKGSCTTRRRKGRRRTSLGSHVVRSFVRDVCFGRDHGDRHC